MRKYEGNEIKEKGEGDKRKSSLREAIVRSKKEQKNKKNF